MRAAYRCSVMQRIPALLLVAALATAACGGDGDVADIVAETSSPTVEPTPTAQPTATSAPEASPAATSAPQPTATAEPETTLTLDVTGLAPLSGNAVYEAWLVVGDEWVSVGSTADLTEPAAFDAASLEAATAVVVTIETDTDPAPSNSRVLAGSLENGSARLSVTDALALAVDFSDASGEYILATPTDGTGAPENERSGVWWTVIPRARSLVLPALGEGWIYEGWQIIDGVAVTTGTFVSQFGEADMAAPYSGPQPGPPFPGEDFLLNAPDGLEFPRDLRGTEVVITVEPLPDTSLEPFALIPLRGVVPADAEDHVAYRVENVADDLPIGQATIG